MLTEHSYTDFLTVVINNSMIGAIRDYKDPNKLEGACHGLDACRDKSTDELLEIKQEVRAYLKEARLGRDSQMYWWFRAYEAQVEWVLNVISGLLVINNQKPVSRELPTQRGYKAAQYIIQKNF